ncbi:MAG: PilC/PilY family type IV pilus protein [Gallionella sp.]|nr:PilC/PilY family type IV pilus protein [Gallionella sp.]
MKRCLENRTTAHRQLLSVALAFGLALPLPALAASVALATSPLATSTTSTVKPNLLFVLDNSGSMDWDHMPDDASDGGSAVTFSYGYYGLRSSQCNQVYYDPDTTYLPPVYADGTSYPDSSFTAAKTNGFDSASTTVNLNTGFKASLSLNADSTGQSAYYFKYTGAQDTILEKNYHSTTNTFYNECHSAQGSATGTGVFSKRRLSTTETTTITVSGTASTSVSSITVNGVELMSGASTASTTSSTVAANIAAKITLNGFSATSSSSTVTISGPTSAANYMPVITQSGTMTLTPDVFPETAAAKLTNFANWYSYYRDRMLMMKTSAGRAFSSLNNSYRVGMMKISQTNPVVNLGTFEGAQRTTWYSTLYGMTTSGSTPLRRSLSDAGRYYAGKLAVTDPVQYSCQQNFTILSTDGYWNTGNGYQIDGSSAIGNQDGTAGRPMFDGAQAATTVVTTYTRDNYASQSAGLGSDSQCARSGGSRKKRLVNQPEIRTCSVPGSCTAWANNGPEVYVAPYTSDIATCVSSITLPSPNPTNPAQSGTPVTTAGATGGSSDSLADIAMYYYQNDLRTSTLGNCTGALGAGVDVCDNNVFIGGNDNNTQQHMTTFTLGMGASGWMNYSSSYLTDTGGDYAAVKLGSTADATVCTWQTADTVCNWPIPGMTGSDGLIANIDDLWHAAVNGRGAYFSATNPASLSAGLSNALAGINTRKGAAAAAATSTLNPVAGNNYAYVASYTTVAWKGNLEARGINTDTGVVSENATWCLENVVAGTCAAPGTVVAETSGDVTVYNCVTPNSVLCTGGELVGSDCKVPVATACVGTMNARVSDVSDTRIIKTANSTGTALVDFTHATLTAAQQGYFAASQISALSQWSSLTAAQQTVAEGVNLVNYLRGEYGYEDRTAIAVDNRLYRYREAVIGDALESQPAFIGAPVFSYPYSGYSAYKTAQAARAGTVYMGANDGMLHAFAGDTGAESWAYVPSMVIPNMWKLADKNYATSHLNYVNGSPITSDVCTANCTDSATAVWKTILVAGLNAGGRGYYALDITDPAAPALLWEFTDTTGIGSVKDADIGYSFGKPIISRKANGTWVVLVTSGYNNTSPGNGKGYLYVLNAGTGAIISKIATNVGSTTTPSGLAKITGWNDEPAGNKVGYVYGGDLLGNIWRFDVNSIVDATVADGEIGTGDVMKFATLFSDAAGTSPQPITTAPVLGKIADKRVVFIGTGKYLETGDLTTTQVQTQYAIKDDNAVSTLVNPRNTLVQQTLSNNPDGTATRLTSGNAVNFYTGRGWYVDLPDSGERVNIDSTLVQGTLLVSSIVPSNTVCSPGGYGWLNFFDYKTGGAINTATGLASLKYDATIVGINVLYVQGQPKVGVVTSTNPTPQLNEDVGFAATATGFSGKRVIWRELIP